MSATLFLQWIDVLRGLGADQQASLVPTLSGDLTAVYSLESLEHRFPQSNGLNRIWFAPQIPAVALRVSGIEINAGTRGCWVSQIVNWSPANHVRVHHDQGGIYVIAGALPVVYNKAQNLTEGVGFGQDTAPLVHGTTVNMGNFGGVPSGGGVQIPTGSPSVDFFGAVYVPPGYSLFLFGVSTNTIAGIGAVVEEPT